MSQDTRTTPINVRIPIDLLERLKDHAKAQDRTLSSLVIHYARMGLGRDKMEAWNGAEPTKAKETGQ